MGKRSAKIAAMLSSHVDELNSRSQNGDGGNHVATLLKHLTRFVETLRSENIPSKFDALGKLGFLKDRTTGDEFEALHLDVRSAIDLAMSPGWD